MIRFEKVSFEEYKEARKKTCGYISDEEIKKEYDNIRLPKRSTAGSAGYDFYMPYTHYLNRSVNAGTACNLRTEDSLIPTGIRWVTDRDDLVLLIVPRSGLGFKHGLSLRNTCGVIDSDYSNSKNEGHIMAKIRSENEICLESGSAFMQGIMLPYIKCDDDSSTEIRDGGFGSTDKKKSCDIFKKTVNNSDEM